MQSKRTTNRSIRIPAAALAISAAMYGQTLNTLYSFSHNGLGYQPTSGAAIGPSGQLYGTTPTGGASGSGAAYEIVPPASSGGAWDARVLYTFTGQSGTGSPYGALLLGPSGILYGVDNAGEGAVFQLEPPTAGNMHWRETTIYTFTDSNGSGAEPKATPILGPHSVLYGTTWAGGANSDGVAYRLAPPSSQGGTWTPKTLFNFSADVAENPVGSLALGSDGALYGTGEYGGLGGGTAFQLKPPTAPGGSWTETTIYDFGSQSGDSSLPNGVVLGPNGVLYGTAEGSTNIRACSNGCGTVFQLTPPASPGGPWTETILYTFTGGFLNTDGSQPNSTPVLGPGGVLYGTTHAGGTNNWGTIFEMMPPSPPGGSWTEVVLYSFTDGADGGEPNAVALGSDGNLYGTTLSGGVSNQGTVFQLVLK